MDGPDTMIWGCLLRALPPSSLHAELLFPPRLLSIFGHGHSP